jgi:hypothetical protein
VAEGRREGDWEHKEGEFLATPTPIPALSGGAFFFFYEYEVSDITPPIIHLSIISPPPPPSKTVF